MNNQKYYFVKYREKYKDSEEEKWSHLHDVSTKSPMLDGNYKSDWHWDRVIDFFTEISKEEYDGFYKRGGI